MVFLLTRLSGQTLVRASNRCYFGIVSARKVYERILAGSHNVRFEDFCAVVEAFGYQLDRVRGSHHIYWHPCAPRPLNLQPMGGQAKPYQIRQFLRAVEEFGLKMKET